MIFMLVYPKCTTCKKALKWLEDQGIEYTVRNIVEENPTAKELQLWYEKSSMPLKKLFNTSGNLYKEQHLKEKLLTMSETEQLQLLSTNGMLVKRPLVIGENFVLAGFKESLWLEKLK